MGDGRNLAQSLDSAALFCGSADLGGADARW
jgi:hypothetical protein